MFTGGVTPPPVQLVMPWIFEIGRGTGEIGPDLLGRLLEGQAGRPGQDGEDVLVPLAGPGHPVQPALHELHAGVAARLLVGGGGRHQDEVAVGLGRGLLGELGRVLLGEPVDHLGAVVRLLHGLEQALGRVGVGVLGHVLHAGALHRLHVGGVVGVGRRGRRVVHVVEAVTRVGRHLVGRLGLGSRHVEVDHGGLPDRIRVRRLQVVRRTRAPSSRRCPGWRRNVGRAAGCGGRDLGGHVGDAAAPRRLGAAVVEARGVADHGEVAGAGLLRVGVVGARVAAVVEGLDLDLPAADAARRVDVGRPRLRRLLGALGEARRHAADAGDVPDVDGRRRHPRRRGAPVAARRRLVPVAPQAPADVAAAPAAPPVPAAAPEATAAGAAPPAWLVEEPPGPAAKAVPPPVLLVHGAVVVVVVVCWRSTRTWRRPSRPSWWYCPTTCRAPALRRCRRNRRPGPGPPRVRSAGNHRRRRGGRGRPRRARLRGADGPAVGRVPGCRRAAVTASAPPARPAGPRRGCAVFVRAGRRSGRWPARCDGPPPPGACSMRSAPGRRRR